MRIIDLKVAADEMSVTGGDVNVLVVGNAFARDHAQAIDAHQQKQAGGEDFSFAAWDR